MSASNPLSKVSLEISTPDPSTEIYIIDGQFQLAGRGLGNYRIDLDPGIYKVKIQAGNEIKEELVVLPVGSPPVFKKYKKLAFASPAPLDDTGCTHEYHMDASFQHSQKVHLTAGQGSAVFVFTREWTPGWKKPRQWQNPSRGLSLRKADGDLVADLAKISANNLDESEDPWAAANVVVDPGYYRLRLELPSGQIFELPIYSPLNWQTQVFTLQRDYSQQPGDRFADLPGASILLARCETAPNRSSFQGFKPGDPELRLVELARQGITSQRQILSDELRNILWGKYQDPMLGIFGAHMLLMESKPNFSLLETVIENLSRLVGDKNPDVEALRSALPGGTSYVFEKPPMLQRSWRLVLKASVARPELVPPGSFAAQMSMHLWGSEPWLMWSLPPDWSQEQQGKRKGKATPEERRLEKILKAHLTQGEEKAGWPVDQASTGLPGAGLQDFSFGLSMETGEKSVGSRMDEETINSLVKTTGIPRASLEQMIDKLDKGKR